jgi:hypothetical protein
MSKSNPPETLPRDTTLAAAPGAVANTIPLVGQVGWVNNNGPTNNSAIVITGPQDGEYQITFGPILNNTAAPVTVSAYIFIGQQALSPASAQLHALPLNPDPANVQPGTTSQLIWKLLNPGSGTTWICTTPTLDVSFPCSIFAQGFVQGGAVNESLANYLNAFRVM